MIRGILFDLDGTLPDRNGYVWKDAVYRQLIEETGWPLHAEELLEDYVSGFGAHCIGFANLMDMLGAAYAKRGNIPGTVTRK
ncbi:hypothetical protein [Saccharibacillus deserti]|uniref:hypothetical protein n=1 Tax=Saccharibacillus deserti TaxID=1634444 RepID=UPI00155799CB|nr:hypothetical protein [Saccharibacillus deserti]